MEQKRLLAGIEHSLTLSNEFSPFNVVCVLKIEGPLGAERLRAAFEALQKKHRLLRARIVSEKGRYYFAWDNVGPVPVTCIERNSADDWVGAAQDELDRRMDISAGPLLRCLFLQDTSEPGSASEIILTLNHTILDASSAVPLLREFLRACSNESFDHGPEVVHEGAVAAPSLFPDHLTGLGYARAVASFMFRQMADEARYKWRTRGCRKPPIMDAGRNRILPRVLSTELTEALVRATRRERITMNAILTAALMLAVKRRLYPSKDTPFRNITFADLRPYLRVPQPGSMMGCFMGMCRLTIQMQDYPDFWKLARELNDAIYRSNRQGERFLSNALSPGMMKMIIRMKSMRMGTTAISYAGPVTLEDSGSPIQVRGLHAFTTNMTIGPEFSALARLFKARIWVDYLYMDSDMDPETAGRIADECARVLGDAVSDSSRERGPGGARSGSVGQTHQ
jgi:NRPS condensation-like uncharacterized protein